VKGLQDNKGAGSRESGVRTSACAACEAQKADLLYSIKKAIQFLDVLKWQSPIIEEMVNELKIVAERNGN
jgi:hypothetical protein